MDYIIYLGPDVGTQTSDLETIIRNMETEAATDFTYVAEDAEGKSK